MVNDTIADFLTRIRNALARQKQEIDVPSSNMLVAMAKILKQEGFIEDYSVVKATPQNALNITLKYADGKSVIYKLQRVSKPGVRRYMGYRNIPRVKRGVGIAIFSTPQGLMTGKEAREKQVGGEYLCNIW